MAEGQNSVEPRGKSRPARLNAGEIRRVFRLLGEIRELGRDPSIWRLHMLKELSSMVDARAGIVGEHYICPGNAADTRMVGVVEFGWLPSEQAVFHEYARTGAFANDPMHAYTQIRLHRSYTRRRCDMVSDEVWYASPLVSDVRRRCNVDDTIHSRQNLPQAGWDSFISIMRAWGQTPFAPRERWMVHLLHRELSKLWRQVNAAPLSTLPTRLQQTLDLMFSGYSEKDMAQALCLSVHTIHDFTRRLYRHFDVTGRGQLLNHPICRQMLFCPALSPAYYEEKRGVIDGSFSASS